MTWFRRRDEMVALARSLGVEEAFSRVGVYVHVKDLPAVRAALRVSKEDFAQLFVEDQVPETD